ncbi:MAG: response regulator [Desulfobacterales bacterium]
MKLNFIKDKKKEQSDEKIFFVLFVILFVFVCRTDLTQKKCPQDIGRQTPPLRVCVKPKTPNGMFYDQFGHKVDDNATSRDIFQEMLESFSFEVSLAVSGEEGITELEAASKDKPYQLVIMDWKMPDMDGIEVSKRIKDHKGLSNIPPIILVTAYGREEILQQAEQLGLEGFLLKPVSPSMLFDTILQAFGEALPETSRVAQRHEQDAEVLKHIRGAHVLLVEDNEINQQVAREILEGAGLTVALATNGQEAVNAVKENKYDAVLMDVQMPVMDGYTATKRIRNWEGGRRKSEVGMRPATSSAESNAETEVRQEASNLQPPTSNL